jgi:NhaP-type Na+/H+ or K+/H+ antiporter
LKYAHGIAAGTLAGALCGPLGAIIALAVALPNDITSVAGIGFASTLAGALGSLPIVAVAGAVLGALLGALAVRFFRR